MKKIIKIGDMAPAFQTTDLWGNAVTVPARDHWMYLSFHRFAACPFCNLRTNELIRHYNSFREKNIEVVSLWPSDRDSLLQYAGGEKSPFPMVSDQTKSIYEAYGVTASSWVGAVRLLAHPQLVVKALSNQHKAVEVDADPKLMPASFLVDPHGVIQLAYYGKHFGDHPAIDFILQSKK